MDKMEILLEQLELAQLVEQLKTARLNKVVIEDNIFYFEIHLSSLLDYHEYTELLKHRNLFPYECHFKFVLDHHLYKENDIVLYFQYFCELYQIKYPQLSSIEAKHIKLEQDLLKIELVSEIQLSSMSMVKTLLNNFFKQLGVELLVDFYVNKQNEDYLKIINQMENDAKKTVDIQPTVSNTPVKKENKYVPYNSKKYNDVIALKLNEITGIYLMLAFKGMFIKQI